jgi:hypothetical protein
MKLMHVEALTRGAGSERVLFAVIGEDPQTAVEFVVNSHPGHAWQGFTVRTAVDDEFVGPARLIHYGPEQEFPGT